MRGLIISKMPPWPPDTGGRVRLWHLLRRMARRIDLTVVAFGGDAVAVEACQRAGFTLVSVPTPERPRGIGALVRKLAGCLWGSPTEVRHWESVEMTRTIRRVLSEGEFDFMQAEFYQMVPYLFCVDSPLPRRFATLHDLGWVPIRRTAEQRGGLKRAYLAIQARRTRVAELSWYSRLDAVWTVSMVDKERLLSEGLLARIEVVPNGAECGSIVPLWEERTSPRALFIGSAAHLPNVDGIRWYLDEVHELVRNRVDGYTLEVVGMDSSAVPGGAEAEGVQWHARVPDVAPFYERARVAIAPLRIGGGTRMKILEAMAYGVPVVSTAVGIEGIQAINGVHFLEASDAGGFADGVVKLVSAYHEEIAREARQLVETGYSFRAASRIQLELYEDLLSAREDPS